MYLCTVASQVIFCDYCHWAIIEGGVSQHQKSRVEINNVSCYLAVANHVVDYMKGTFGAKNFSEEAPATTSYIEVRKRQILDNYRGGGNLGD